MIFHLILATYVLAADLPSYSPNNPNGAWHELPRGRNYMFCGDRILYGQDFKARITIEGVKTQTMSEHCRDRSRAIQLEAKNRNYNTDPAYLPQFDRLHSFISKIPIKNREHQRIIQQDGYHFGEIIKVQSEKDLNTLRAANLVLPYLSRSDFARVYAGSTNNQAFIETEYSRYSSNILTQNPAMLYTAEGRLYYFSFNLSPEQLRLMNSVTGGGSGGGMIAGGGGGPSGGGSQGNLTRAQLQSLRDDKGNIDPAKAFEMGLFPGFQSRFNHLKIDPQETNIPSNFRLENRSPLNVPSISRLAGSSSAGAEGQSSNRHSSSQRAASSPATRQTTNVSQRPSSSPMIPPAVQFAQSRPSSGGSRQGESFSNRQPSRSPSSVGGTQSTGSTRAPASVLAQQGPEIGAKSLVLDTSASVTKPLEGPPAVRFAQIRHDTNVQDLSCKSSHWPLLLHGMLNVGLSHENNSCIPQNLGAFCGDTNLPENIYSKECMDEDTNSRNCYEHILKDLDGICRKYVNLSYDEDAAPDIEQILNCAKVISALACNKVPCELNEITRSDEGSEVKNIERLVVSLYNNGSDLFTSGLSRRFKSLEELREIHRLRPVGNFEGLNQPLHVFTYIKEDINTSRDNLTRDLLKLTSFYTNYFDQEGENEGEVKQGLQNMCSRESSTGVRGKR